MSYVLSEQNIIKFCLDVNDPECTLLFCLICLFKHLWSYVESISDIIPQSIKYTTAKNTREAAVCYKSLKSSLFAQLNVKCSVTQCWHSS